MNNSKTDQKFNNIPMNDADLQCVINIKWEMKGLLKYLIHCNNRKLNLFKLFIATFSILVTALIATITLSPEALQTQNINSNFHIMDLISLFILFFIGLINLSIIKEWLSIYISRLVTYRQMNAFRRALDSLRYQKYYGEYPSLQDLRNKELLYWKKFGNYRKLTLDNTMLKKEQFSISSFFTSPDKFAIFSIFLLSIMILGSPCIYMLFIKKTFITGFFCGVIFFIFITLFFIELFISKRKMVSALTLNEADYQ
ncbi:MAG: hypothetical protein B6I26_02930 [Desulfobacteraceae bacterium 4572_130]|nr:MAG: hypothetical protein B6I26_02930 [Desulfobacteraceae bacterium 4572_130]